MPKLLSAIELAVVGTLPAASANTGTLMRTSAGAFYSNGTSWARIDNVVTDWATSLDNIPANITSWAGIAPAAKQDGAASSGANRLSFNTGQSTAMGTAASELGGLELRGAGGANAAFMCFHRPGYYAAYFGLDTDNVWKVGGWSMGNFAHTLWHSGNLLNIGTTAATARAALVMATTDDVILRDVTVARADGTGALFMNSAQTRYLYWNNTTYVLNVAAGQGEIWHTLATPGGGNRLSKITCSSAAPGTLQDGELYLRF